MSRSAATPRRAIAKPRASRMVTARQQLERTEVRAPFDGIVSDRKVSAGDTAQVGKELLKVIDPTSLRFEGLVSADSIGEVQAGQQVWFRIHGFDDREFTGKVMRVNPSANATTRQVEVLVAFDEGQGTAERRRPVRRRSRRNSKHRGAHSARRIGGARGRQRVRLARQGRRAAEGGAHARRARSRAAARSWCIDGLAEATRCCATRARR